MNKKEDNYTQKCAKVLEIDKDVHNCHLCADLVEKFGASKTIHYGNNNDILILGEAPANNGWRKSGIVWHDKDGKILPSGVVMQKLLDILGLNLMDVTFLEAIKCYPKERKNLMICKNNCSKILSKQLEILKPKIILALGDMATKAILKINYKKFSDVVGQVYEIEYGIKVIPIYHPSPISPLSYKGNVPIFNKIKEIC